MKEGWVAPDPDTACGESLTFRDFFEAGETWARHRVDNIPRQKETFEAIERLCRDVLDPVRRRFGPFRITYGFAGPQLTRLVPGQIDRSLDQHAGHELKPRGTGLICPREGQAADFLVPGVSSIDVARWIAEATPFDRLYVYGHDRPLHVSAGPQQSRAIIAMRVGPSGRRVPRRLACGELASLRRLNEEALPD